MRPVFILFIFLFFAISTYSQGTISESQNGAKETYFEWFVFEDDTIFTISRTPRTRFWDEVSMFPLVLDIVLNDFDAFESVLGTHNTDFLRNTGLVIGMELSGTRRGHSVGFSFGFLYMSDAQHDYLNIRLNSTRFGLNYGFNLIDSRRLRITPTAGIQWSRYRLLNSARDRISLAQYMSDRDVDLRFNQMTASIVMRLSYKVYDLSVANFWTIGIYGGYIANLNMRPWIFSVGDRRLRNEHRINLFNYTVGIFLSLHF